MIGALLTTAIGLVAKGVAAKARAGGVATAVVAVGGPVVDMLHKGFVEGIAPSIEQVGLLAGQAVGAFIIGYAVTWFAPKNKEA
jgi:hypothetical protein